ncbi:hypothetical protein EZV62_015316 [Acer yangbiense]|uniref:Uncharacterized protein n=1 Tax=Acer yangbiense TaxID=1000413 RepID=A0A5C7HKC9_9ROSI|nr:hypothetical protein EZV62_015316 [Acer yangbiense]
MATVARLRYSIMSTTRHFSNVSSVPENRQISFFTCKLPAVSHNHSLRILRHQTSAPRFQVSSTGGGNNGTGGGNNSGGGGGGDGSGGFDNSSSDQGVGALGLLASGWRSRVAADSQFPFKVLMEQLVGVTACVLGDMASRPNFGLNELDFVFSTLVVGSILNFTLMYLLAPTIASTSQTLPGIFSKCPTSHMFQPGPYSFINRLGTFVFKGVVFASVGFAAGFVGTSISNGLIKLRKKMDPTFETPNKAPPPILNSLTWALHMGISSNLRYQTLNGVEFMLEKTVPGLVFKSSVVVLRCLNNVLGGMSFVILARMTGAQSVGGKDKTAAAAVVEATEKQKLLDDGDENLKSTNNQSTN